MTDPIVVFRDALASAGVLLHPSATILADGCLHRARSADDRPGKMSCWYRLHLDAPVAGAGGDWRKGISTRWCSKRQSSLTPAERETLRQRIEQDKRRAEAEQQARHAGAARTARRIWDRAEPADPSHAYLQRKGIAPGVGRQLDGLLLLPVLDFSGTLHGLQFIDETGGKRFSSGMSKRGHFIPTAGLPDGTKPLYLSEGFATSSTLATMKPEACHIAALDCGNLAAVADAARKRWPKLQIVIAGDFDAIGRQKAKEAAEQARAMLLPPPARIEPGQTDWNDYVTARKGVQHV